MLVESFISFTNFFVWFLHLSSFVSTTGRVESDKFKKYVSRVESGPTPMGRIELFQWITLGQQVGLGWLERLIGRVGLGPKKVSYEQFWIIIYGHYHQYHVTLLCLICFLRLLGVVAADIYLKDIHDLMEATLTGDAYSFLLHSDTKQTVLYHPLLTETSYDQQV